MGLFDFKSPERWAQDVVDFEKAIITNNTNEQIVKAGLRGLIISGSYANGNCNFCPTAAGMRLKEYYSLNLKGLKLKDKLKWVSAYELFCIAKEAGSGDAAFFLGVIHEHGLCGIEQDQEEANNYYNLAIARNCKLAAALAHMKPHMKIRHDMSTNQYESLAIHMHTVCYAKPEILPEATTIRSMLSQEDLGRLLQISTYLLFFYAAKECPQSLALLYLLLDTNDKSVNDGLIHRYFYDETYASTIGKTMGLKVWNMAKAGDSQATAACQAYHIIGI